MDIIKFEHVINKSIDEIIFEIPEIQRSLSDENVKNIYEFQNNYYKTHGEYCLNGTISIAIANTIQYLIDGMHRITALKILRREFPERNISLNIDYFYINVQDLEKIYKFVNTHLPNSITALGIDNYKIINDIEKYMLTQFKNYIKSSKNPHKPNFNIQSLKSYIIENKIIEKIEVVTSKQFIDEIIELNNYYSKLDPLIFQNFGVEKIYETLEIIKLNTNKFYLGIYHQFEWIERIFDKLKYNKSYNDMNHYSYSYRPKITKKLRNSIWNCEFTKSNCYCCNDIIEYDTFECGHVIPLIFGGNTTLDNLKKICASCNSDMGRMNLEDYKKLIETQIQKI